MFNADDRKTLLQLAGFASLIASIGFVADQFTNPRRVLTVISLDPGRLVVNDDLGSTIQAMSTTTHRVKKGIATVTLTTSLGELQNQVVIGDGSATVHLGLISFKDTRDDSTYTASWHGPLLWMSDNLNFKLGDSIASKNNPPAQLYTWEQAQRACPKDWRLPSHDELKALAISLGGVDLISEPSVGDSTLAGRAMTFTPEVHLNFSLTGAATLNAQGDINHSAYASDTSYWSSSSHDNISAYALKLRHDSGSSTTRRLKLDEKVPKTIKDPHLLKNPRLIEITDTIDPSVSVLLNELTSKSTYYPIKCVRPFNGDKNIL